MTKVMAGAFAIVFVAFTVGSTYLSGDLTAEGLQRFFGVS